MDKIISMEELEEDVTVIKAPGNSFGWAITELKLGHKVTRDGWNGRGMYLWLKPGTEIQEEWCRDPFLKEICHANGGYVYADDVICMYTAQHTVVTGWLASQTDMLAKDWRLVE